MENASCLVTGGAGFIGSHLCQILLEKGYLVYCLDNLLTGNISNIKPLEKNLSFRFFKTDITKDKWLRYFNNKKVNYIYHLASPASPPQYRRYSIETLLVNSLGTYNLLQLSKASGSRFLLASTSEVYGDPQEHPQKESYFGFVNPVGIRACYDESKRFAEAITMEYYRKYKLDIRIIRIFNTYGPNMQVTDGRVISNFITQAISGQSLTIYGSGRQTRSFCYVSDMVGGLIKAMEVKQTTGKILNLGNPEEVTIRNLADLILVLTGSSSKIVKLNKRFQDDPEKRKPDITLAKKLLGFHPQISLNEGLKISIDYFRNL
ncbi:NAD-dependent dehydratase [Candidatus Gottesmanbacteria bacterium RIFCSPHIGHO2_02_FULL_39_14]|uniref:UDP-glucuronate decarboxylase n=2 Tax=Candidatus Gottesmaniibacteriota TaxID=1752720 RepID=A0A1F5ZWL9_9BACT|nr:MAG: NAD-dependent dehydratase [Candidatus Gottesmanbacteria bacterium RBG_16_38_7b]OGG16715.1 MAG: NAD-dependent dehydratase [Candidatus Gottesmanbacteria bacterium RIFCSPHIGHO2_02_FULL_39_14]